MTTILEDYWRRDDEKQSPGLESMLGKTMHSVVGKKGDEEMIFTDTEGVKYRFWYDHDCCANCTIEDIIGDLSDLVGSPITMAEEISNSKGATAGRHDEDAGGYGGTFTWTFYKFATVKGYVTVRWYGSSNGYYSENVTFGVSVPPEVKQ